MIVYPNCKINLGLKVLNQRDDGFHNIESVIVPVPLYDALEIMENKKQVKAVIDFSISGASVEGELNTNLCVKAYTLLDQDFKLPPVNMHLHKIIPMGAGLGGGSSDGAFTLVLLNQIFGLGIKPLHLKKYALKLGSDCPFFIENAPSMVGGRGEKIKKIAPELEGLHIVIIYPGIHISTALAYKNLQKTVYKDPLQELPDWNIKIWQKKLKNDFEPYAFAKYPLLKKLKEALYSKGAVYASMSGSGSAIYGLFDAKIKIPKAWEKYFTFQTSIGNERLKV